MLKVTHPSLIDLELKKFSPDDASTLFNVVEKNRINLKKWLPWLDRNQSIEDSELFIKHSIKGYDNDELSLGIWCDKRFIGVISFHYINLEKKECGMGYWLDTEWEGKGIISAATETMIEYAFNILKMESVIIRCGATNNKSRHIPERLGFDQVEVLENAENLYGHLHDLVVYRLIKPAWVRKKYKY